MLTAGGRRWRLSTDSFGWASSGWEIGRDDVGPEADPRCLWVCHGWNMQYMSDAWVSLRLFQHSFLRHVIPAYPRAWLVCSTVPGPRPISVVDSIPSYPNKISHLPLWDFFFFTATIDQQNPGTQGLILFLSALPHHRNES